MHFSGIAERQAERALVREGEEFREREREREMSLVDYASSSDDDVSESGEDHQHDPEEAPNENPQLPVSPQNQ